MSDEDDNRQHPTAEVHMVPRELYYHEGAYVRGLVEKIAALQATHELQNREIQRLREQPNRNRRGQQPCGECHIQPGETCDICGAAAPRPGEDAVIRVGNVTFTTAEAAATIATLCDRAEIAEDQRDKAVAEAEGLRERGALNRNNVTKLVAELIEGSIWEDTSMSHRRWATDLAERILRAVYEVKP